MLHAISVIAKNVTGGDSSSTVLAPITQSMSIEPWMVRTGLVILGLLLGNVLLYRVAVGRERRQREANERQAQSVRDIQATPQRPSSREDRVA
jgi:hypothetical protein